MSPMQRVAQIFGWIFVLIAVWGAVVAGTSMEADPSAAPRLWGIFPVNLVHNLVHLAFGIWGITAARKPGSARSYAAWAGVLYLLLAVVGFFAPSGFGLVPLGGNDIWLHVLIGAALVGSTAVLAPATDPVVEPAGTRTVTPPTASSPEGTVTRPPAQPTEPEGDAEPVEPEPAHSEGAAEAAPPPSPPEHVVDEPRRQPEERPDARAEDRERPEETDDRMP